MPTNGKRKKARRSRGLVVGYIERISSKAFDDHSREITDLIGRQHGIYALYHNKSLYYVGLATNLRNRVKHHLKDRHRGKWNYFSLYLVRSRRHLKELESLCLRIADPAGNRFQGRFAAAKNLRSDFKRSLIRKSREQIEATLGSGRRKSRTMVLAGRKAAATRKRNTFHHIPLSGVLSNVGIKRRHKGTLYRGKVLKSGRIRVNGRLYDSPSEAASAVVGHRVSGWKFWLFRDSRGKWVSLAVLPH